VGAWQTTRPRVTMAEWEDFRADHPKSRMIGRRHEVTK
jgi:hypothetical protein